MRYLLSLFVLCASAFGQSAPAFTVSAGTDPITARICNDAVNVGSIFTTITNPSVTYVCQQTGAPSLGQGAYAWVSSFQASVTGGTLTIAANKTPVLSKSITFTGTDSTTMTFPTTSATIARTDAANTFTGVQTLSSAPVFSTGTLTNTGTVTLPTTTGGVPVLIGCGATSGNAACANTASGATARIITGIATLSSSSAVISSISPTFTSTSTFSCSGQDVTTITNPIKIVNTSSSSITITDQTGASDVVNWQCAGY